MELAANRENQPEAVVSKKNAARKRTIRNLIIFSVAVIASGWIGAAVNSVLGLTGQDNLGMLVWIVVPLGTSLVLRAFAGDGWTDIGVRPRFRGNGVWYLGSITAYPAMLLGILAMDLLLGWVSLENFSSDTAVLFLSTFGLALLPTFFKNIFEEFAWRGYLTPKVNLLGLNAYAGHFIVALIWWAWHVPYYLLLLDRAALEAAIPIPFEIFLAGSLVELLALSIVMGELRLLTASTWPAVLFHTVYNAFPAALLALGVLTIVPGLEPVAALGPGGLLPLVLLFVVGVGLKRTRKKN